MNNKGFTLVELLGVIVIIAILSSLAVLTFNTVIQNGRKGVYKTHEQTLADSGRDYLIENIDEKPSVGEVKKISFQTLKNKDFLAALDDPAGGSCTNSCVIITRGADKGINYTFTYKGCLICSKYRTSGCDCNGAI